MKAKSMRYFGQNQSSADGTIFDGVLGDLVIVAFNPAMTLGYKAIIMIWFVVLDDVSLESNDPFNDEFIGIPMRNENHNVASLQTLLRCWASS